MPIQYKIRRGSTSEANSLTLTEGEIYMDLGDKSLRVHDGATQGGTALAKKLDLNSKVDKINISAGTVGSGSEIPVITYNKEGQITSVSTASLNIPSNIATETYVNTQISNLVDSSPETLNTLNELAAALGDDPNFATTVSNQIGLKANSADLATVATSGSYYDLTNRPFIPNLTSDLMNDAGYLKEINLKTINGQSIVGTGDIPVFSGNYNNLTNKPFEINSNIPTSAYDINVNGLTVGKGAGSIITNTALGRNTLYFNTTGNKLVAIGDYALFQNTTGYENIAVGANSLYNNTTGRNNTSVGHYALTINTTGSYNSAYGSYALENSTANSNNTAFGYRANRGTFTNGAGGGNTAVGADALLSNYGDFNIAVGNLALRLNADGYDNVSIGSLSSYNNVSGNSNIAIGKQALYNNTVSGNVAIGKESLYANTTGSGNIGIGNSSLRNTNTGYLNIGIGIQALNANTTGYTNTAIGNYSLSTLTTGNSNTIVGYRSGIDITTGSSNTVIGNFSGNSNGVDIRTSNNNIVLSDGDGWPGLIIKNGVGTTLKSVAAGAGTHALNYNPTSGVVSYGSAPSTSLVYRGLLTYNSTPLNIDITPYSELTVDILLAGDGTDIWQTAIGLNNQNNDGMNNYGTAMYYRIGTGTGLAGSWGNIEEYTPVSSAFLYSGAQFPYARGHQKWIINIPKINTATSWTATAETWTSSSASAHSFIQQYPAQSSTFIPTRLITHDSSNGWPTNTSAKMYIIIHGK